MKTTDENERDLLLYLMKKTTNVLKNYNTRHQLQLEFAVQSAVIGLENLIHDLSFVYIERNLTDGLNNE